MKGLLAMVAKVKPKGEADEPDAEEASEAEPSNEDDFARVAFDAVKNDDEDAFVEAFKGAIRACVDAYSGE